MSNYVTAIGLDVHARSIKACALNPMTGEVSRASFGYDPASVAEWGSGFKSPKAVYIPALTASTSAARCRALGLELRRRGRLQDAAARPPTAAARPTRRDAEFLARLLACRQRRRGVRVPDERTAGGRPPRPVAAR